MKLQLNILYSSTEKKEIIVQTVKVFTFVLFALKTFHRFVNKHLFTSILRKTSSSAHAIPTYTPESTVLYIYCISVY